MGKTGEQSSASMGFDGFSYQNRISEVLRKYIAFLLLL